MNCRDVQKFVYVYLDEEFDKSESVEFEAHVSQCAPCREAVGNEERFRRRLRNQLLPCTAPESLRNRICQAMQVQALSEEAVAPQVGPSRDSHAHRPRMALAFAASIAAAAVVSYLGAGQIPAGTPDAALNVSSSLAGAPPIMAAQPRPHDSDDILEATLQNTANEAVALHQSDLPLDVQGEREEVERFLGRMLGGRVDMPIRESAHTHLIGARLVSAGPQPAILFNYDHRGRRVSVLMRTLPLSDPGAMHVMQVRRLRGYNAVVMGQDPSRVATVVTDSNHDEVHTLIASSLSH